MRFSRERSMSRRGFCLCCVGGAAYAATGEWLTPREAFAEARGLVSMFKDNAAVASIATHKLRNNFSVLEGSGGNIAVLTGPDGKVLIDGGIGASRPQLTKALADLGTDPISHLVNTHWHFDHTSGNEWLHAAGARIIAQENTRKYLSEVQRVDDERDNCHSGTWWSRQQQIRAPGIPRHARRRPGNIAALKKKGKSKDEIVAAKPGAAFGAKWGGGPIDPGFFTRLVYEGV